MTTLGIEHGAKGIMKQAAKAAMKKRERDKLKAQIERDKAAMKYQPKKDFGKEPSVSKAPKRSDFQKGKVGDIKYNVAYRKWLEKIS